MLYEQAQDAIEGMLISVDEPSWYSSIAMSQTYLEQFELITKNSDTSGAFSVQNVFEGELWRGFLKTEKQCPQWNRRRLARWKKMLHLCSPG